MKFYICGPMRHHKDFNKYAFYDAEDYLKSQGHTCFNPCRYDEEVLGIELLSETGDVNDIPGFDEDMLNEIIIRDTTELVQCDAIYLLNGWRKSKGAMGEYAISQWKGMPDFYEYWGLVR